MDRTTIAPWKAEEKEQSEKLHKKLQGLSLLCPMTDEMIKLLSWDMFLKSNQPAFFQVMHYLFRIIDAVEFKRRFYWPITDKKSEANFRASTVDYLKHLNEKHQLNWSNIKSYLVVMPGGMKFINFLLDLVGFVVQELIKQREKALSLDSDMANLRDLSVQSMSRQNVFMKEYISAYIDETKQLTVRLRQNTQQIRNIFTEIANKTGVDETLLLHDKFLEDFEAYNRLKCKRKIGMPLERISMLEAPQCQLKEDMEQFLARLTEQKLHKEAADITLRSIQKFFGAAPDAGSALGNGMRLGTMLSALNDISETIAEQLDANNHYDHESNEFRTTELRELRDKLQQIEQQVNEVNKNLNLRFKEQTGNVSGNASQMQHTMQNFPNTPLRSLKPPTNIDSHTLLMKFVSTPPIKLDAASGVRSLQVRLPLQDDFNAKQFDTTCNSLLVPVPPRSARKIKQQNEEDMNNTDMNNTINRSKILDPMRLLRTINKKSAQPKTIAQPNLSSLGSKWKQMQASFGFEDVNVTAVPTSPKASNCMPQSPFTPLNINDNTRIERLPDTSSNNSLYSKKSAAVMKVLDASLNVQNLSTSPSGRLEALVPGPMIEPKAATPIILLNDLVYDSEPAQCINNENDGNQLNQLNCSKFGDDFAAFGDNDDLQNISDSVLNDILI
ncbi:augmin complex subunit dgt6 [Drosophila albomicans]|uniref:Augmin complex subunit dgt6 n=1 Tax=Drosophila albomicans TaxID=7291 RepID=A0A6P8XME5_DROAB|nr:augmin complex subunit dgt6 [Drosophila albomicans]